MKHTQSNIIPLVLALLFFIAVLVYGFIGIFDESYTLSNILSVSVGVIAFIRISHQMYKNARDNKDAKDNKKEDVYRRLSDKYETYSRVKIFINDNLDRNGNLKEEPYRAINKRPTRVEIEDFMRFFKDLKWEIYNGNVTWDIAAEKFSKYALLLDENEFFRSTINDYYSSDWDDFRDYCAKIRKQKHNTTSSKIS